MDSTRRFSGGDALNAVNTRFEFEPGISSCTFNQKGYLLETTYPNIVLGQHFNLPVLLFSITAVHSKKVGSKKSSFISPCSGTDLHDDILLITRIPGNQ